MTDRIEADSEPISDNDRPIPEDVTGWAVARLGDAPTPGYGYGSWVFVGKTSVIKVDPIAGRSGSFDSDGIADGLVLGGVATPAILGRGHFASHEWIEISRIPGVPAYEIWLDLPRGAQSRITSGLRSFLNEWRTLSVDESLLHDPDEKLVTVSAIQRALGMALPHLPGEYATGAVALAAQRESLALTEPPLPRVLVHRDLWFGNMLVTPDGDLTGIIDFGHVVMAEPEAELDTLLRFWRFPRLYVPEEWETAYRAPLDLTLIEEIARDCTACLGPESAVTRIAAYDLAYRLQKIAEFGWNADQAMFLDAIFDQTHIRELLRLPTR